MFQSVSQCHAGKSFRIVLKYAICLTPVALGECVSFQFLEHLLGNWKLQLLGRRHGMDRPFLREAGGEGHRFSPHPAMLSALGPRKVQ